MTNEESKGRDGNESKEEQDDPRQALMPGELRIGRRKPPEHVKRMLVVFIHSVRAV